MKPSSRSRSLPYTLLFCQLLALAFVAAYGVTWALQQPAPPDPAAPYDQRQLLANYRLLHEFMAPPAAAQNDPAGAPLRQALAALERAQRLLDAGQAAAALTQLDGFDDRYPHLTARRDALRVRLLHAAGRFAELADFSSHLAGLGPGERVLRLDALLKTRRRDEAAAEFRSLFASPASAAAFQPSLAHRDWLELLRGLRQEDWFSRYSLLLQQGQAGEFRRLSPLAPYPELNRLFQAEFAYRRRAYDQARRLLRAPLAEPYRAHGERLLAKLDLRADPGSDVEARLERIGADSPLYAGLLLDLAQILTGSNESARARSFYRRYLEAGAGNGETYWKTVWLLAWSHYRQGERDEALACFRKGGESPISAYAVASRYWQARLEGSPPPDLRRTPFSYYAVRTLAQDEIPAGGSDEFLQAIAAPPSPRLRQIVAELQALVRSGHADEAAAAARWGKDDPRLEPGDRSLLGLIEPLLHFQQRRYYLAYTAFRANFPGYDWSHLPRFLGGLFLPRAYEELIASHSRSKKVDPALVLALIREESFFRSDARSPANALGLMQLLPATARQVAGREGRGMRARDLYDPELNVRLGLEYLRRLLDRYDNRLYLALAAYNAGPHRVDRWLQDFHPADEEEFIEMIPFSETRNYVKNILRNYFFYRHGSESGRA